MTVDIALRRRAILTGLRPFLDDDALLSAVALWAREYANQPPFALSGFVAKCCARAEHLAQRGQMLRAIIAAMELPPSQLLPDPGSQGEILAAVAEQARLNDQTQMFSLLLSALIGLSDASMQSMIRSRLLQQLTKQKLEREPHQVMQDWLAGHVVSLTKNYDLKLLQALVNQAYIVMCEVLGPVKADQLLANAIRQVDIQGAHLSFRVHDLL
ncbi:hypothetical protein ACIKP9_04605 [Methylobacillus methanolivorans]|uniref:Uncharacterized protein n=1 Tax=Methylobacillus methanolivorans TaxID=1848927 RepID=A0ABW8GJE6_9PROT